MTRKDFEQKYLNKMVEVTLFDNDIFRGYLYSTNDYMKKTRRLDNKNYYFVGNDIRENSLRFRKSHIKKIRILSCLNISKHYKLGSDNNENIEFVRKYKKKVEDKNEKNNSI